MEVVTAREMAEIDRRAVAEFGLTVDLLMEQAGFHAAAVAASLLPRAGGSGRVAVVAGRGNNGGDGLVAARHLHQWGMAVEVLLVGAPGELSPAAAVNWERLERAGVPRRLFPGPAAADLGEALRGAALVVDALLGTGARPPLSPALAAAIEAVNAAGRPVLAVDLPSGLDADTGRPLDTCVRACATVTFCRPKLGLLLEPGTGFSGGVALAALPIPEEAVRRQGAGAGLLTGPEAARFLPPRPPSGHKGTFGHVLVIAGAAGYEGAAALASLAALRGGAGRVTLACPGRVAAALAGRFPEVMVRAVPGEDALTEEAAPALAELAARAGALCAGPGLGRRPETGVLLHRLLSRLDKPLVLDADGLNLLDLPTLAGYAGPLVLTPHPGEMGRLLGIPAEAVQADRPGSVRAAARALGGGAASGRRACVLKGARTLVAEASGHLWVNPTGSTALATAGTGDVLAGLTAALLGQGADPVAAAAAAVHLHGLAGEMAAVTRGSERAVIAGDVLDHLGWAFARVGGEADALRPGGYTPGAGVIWLTRDPSTGEDSRRGVWNYRRKDDPWG